MNEQILGDQDANVSEEDYDDLGGGIASSFPTISYRNSRWRVRWQGNEELLVDDQGRPVEEIGVCLAKVPNHKSKRYWIGGYPAGGSNKPPDCWSNDAIRPHPSLVPPAQPQGWPNQRPTTCAECYWDNFGTSMRQDGSVGRGKACGDYKRCVVKIYYPSMPIGFEAADGLLFLLSIPPDSLQSIKKYGEDLARERLAAAATVTFIGMIVNDQKVSYPKLTFRKGPKLSTDEWQAIKYARTSPEADRILNEIPYSELDGITYEEPQEEEQENTVQSEPVQPAPRPAPPQAPRTAAGPPQARPGIPSGDASNTRISGMPPPPPRPATVQPASPSARAMQPNRPQAPAARAIHPTQPTQIRSGNSVNTRQPGEINRAVNRPAAPPPSTRPVRPQLVAPPPVQSEAEYGTAGEVEDELDKSFGDLAARGVIEQ